VGILESLRERGIRKALKGQEVLRFFHKSSQLWLERGLDLTQRPSGILGGMTKGDGEAIAADNTLISLSVRKEEEAGERIESGGKAPAVTDCLGKLGKIRKRGDTAQGSKRTGYFFEGSSNLGALSRKGRGLERRSRGFILWGNRLLQSSIAFSVRGRAKIKKTGEETKSTDMPALRGPLRDISTTVAGDESRGKQREKEHKSMGAQIVMGDEAF